MGAGLSEAFGGQGLDVFYVDGIILLVDCLGPQDMKGSHDIEVLEPSVKAVLEAIKIRFHYLNMAKRKLLSFIDRLHVEITFQSN